MELVANLLSGFVGALVSAGVTVYIFIRSKPRSKGMAARILRDLQKKLQAAEGEYCRTKSASDNYEVAAHLFKSAEGTIVCTAFHENPADYGEADLATLFRSRDLTRLTCEEVCDSESQRIARKNLEKVHRGAALVVLPGGEKYVRVDGVFCRLRDESYICLIAFRDPTNHRVNRGAVFREDLAESFFDYYQGLAERYGGGS